MRERGPFGFRVLGQLLVLVLLAGMVAPTPASPSSNAMPHRTHFRVSSARLHKVGGGGQAALCAPAPPAASLRHTPVILLSGPRSTAREYGGANPRPRSPPVTEPLDLAV